MFLILVLASATIAKAQTSTFTYQGRLTDASLAASGTYDFEFALYDQTNALIGSAIQRNGVNVSNGVFTTQLDFGASAFPGADRFLEIRVKHPADTAYITLTPRQQITGVPYTIRSLTAATADAATTATSATNAAHATNADNATNANNATTADNATNASHATTADGAASADNLSSACVGCVDNAKITSVAGSKVTGTVANATNATTATTAQTATNNVLKSGDTMTGTLILPANGLTVGTNQIVTSGSGNVGVGGTPGNATLVGGSTISNAEKLLVNGNVSIPQTSNYLYATPKSYRLRVSPAAFVSANPTVYEARYDDGFSSLNVNGLNSFSATGGTPGTAAYFIAPVNLPQEALITGFAAQLVKNGGSLQSVVELYRSDGTGYVANTAQLIASAQTTTSGGLVFTVTAGSINTSFNLVDNANFQYFVRYSGEQATQNLRFSSATITYQVSRPE
jgi:hypothetical protein